MKHYKDRSADLPITVVESSAIMYGLVSFQVCYIIECFFTSDHFANKWSVEALN